MKLLGVNLILLCVALEQGSSFRVTENVVFEKTRDLSVVRSKWLFTFFMDLRSYQGYMQGLWENLKQAEKVINEVVKNDENTNIYKHIWIRQATELDSIKEMYAVAKQELNDIIDIQQQPIKRVKRAILPFGGKILNWAFGTLTKADLRKINDHINVLADNQEQLTHVLNDTLSIVNVTRVEVKQNRHAIKKLVDVMQGMDVKMKQFSHTISGYARQINSFLLIFTQFDMMIAELREGVEKAMFYMDNVRMQLNMLSQGHLAPTVIPPGQLKKILMEIQEQIPNYLALPKSVDDIWYYYQTLTCVTVIKDKRFVTLVNLPLLDLNTQFELYQIHNIPAPYMQSKMSAKYELETDVLAVNAKHTDFVLLTPSELTVCSNSHTGFCTLSSPLYNMGNSRLCVISLFKQDLSAISRNCQTEVRLDTMLPHAVYVPDGNWIIVATDAIDFTIMCVEKDSFHIKTKPPVFSLQMAPACQDFADELTLPAYYHRQSTYSRVEQRQALLSLRDMSDFTLWEPLINLPNGTELTDMSAYPELDDVSDIPLNDLIDKLNRIKKPKKVKNEMGMGEYIDYATVPLVLLCILLTLGIIVYRKVGMIPCCGAAMVRICARADTAQKTGTIDDVENVNQRDETQDDQPRQGTSDARVVQASTKPMTLDLSIDNK